jgi:hypothetical protein
VGTTYHMKPIAPIEQNTVRVPAGAVTFGLEMRELNPALIRAFYQGRPDEEHITAMADRLDSVDDGGPSIHVFGSDDQLEYLRFDCFRNGPHYHYVHPNEEYQVVNEIDPVADGDPFEWALGRLRSRLPEMLRESGGTNLADHVDQAAVDEAIDRVSELAANATRGVRA